MGNWIFFLSFLFFSLKRLKRYLRYFQQEDYTPGRFFKWWWGSKLFDRRTSLGVFLLSFLSTSLFTPWLFIKGGVEPDPCYSGKLPLKLTWRARRILYVAGVMAGVLCYLLPLNGFILILEIQTLPLLLLLANLCLSPWEKRAQLQFESEAKEILTSVNPYIISITGSWGKTSTKSALGQVLEIALAPTFHTSGGVNTLMGNTREIREKLERGSEYAVFEIGAYYKGSIRRHCELIPPQAAIITAVGPCHLERFGSLENVHLAKSELAQAVPRSGILVCNGDDLGARRICLENPKKTSILYGFSDMGFDCYADSVTWDETGSRMRVVWKGEEYWVKTPLVGKAALSNLLGVFAMACTLGTPPESVRAVMGILKPVNNRLQLEKSEGVLYLKDAYNSNPMGFESALDVLAKLPANRKILMTPGMIELGKLQFQENKKIAKLADTICNQLIFVGKENRKAFQTVFPKAKSYFCVDRAQAFQKLRELQQEGDVVLIENDLTDLHEIREKF